MGLPAEQPENRSLPTGLLPGGLTPEDFAIAFPPSSLADTEVRRSILSERASQLVNAFDNLASQELKLVAWADQHPTEFSEETRTAMKKDANIPGIVLAAMGTLINLEDTLGVVPLTEELPSTDLSVTEQHHELMQHIFPLFSTLSRMLHPDSKTQWPNDETQERVEMILEATRSQIKDCAQMTNSDVLNHIWQELNLTNAEDFKAVELAQQQATEHTSGVIFSDLQPASQGTPEEGMLAFPYTLSQTVMEHGTHPINDPVTMTTSTIARIHELRSQLDSLQGEDRETAERELQDDLLTLTVLQDQLETMLVDAPNTAVEAAYVAIDELQQDLIPDGEYPDNNLSEDETALSQEVEPAPSAIELEAQPEKLSSLEETVEQFKGIVAQAEKVLLAAGRPDAFAQLADARISKNTLQALGIAALALDQITPEKANQILKANETFTFTGLAGEYQMYAERMMRIIDAARQLLATDRAELHLNERQAITLDLLDSSAEHFGRSTRRGKDIRTADQGLLAIRGDVDYDFATLQQIQKYQRRTELPLSKLQLATMETLANKGLFINPQLHTEADMLAYLPETTQTWLKTTYGTPEITTETAPVN